MAANALSAVTGGYTSMSALKYSLLPAGSALMVTLPVSNRGR
jgi:hypothetical protein